MKAAPRVAEPARSPRMSPARVCREIPIAVPMERARTSSDTRGGAAVRVPKKRARGLGRRALIAALAYIDAHAGERFSLQDLAAAAAVSRFHFARLFRVSTGESPMAFLVRVRIERARQLLRGGGDTNIAAVAATLGFFDQSHFARTFRRMSGMSPSAFVRATNAPVPMAQDSTLMQASRIAPTIQCATTTAPSDRAGA